MTGPLCAGRNGTGRDRAGYGLQDPAGRIDLQFADQGRAGDHPILKARHTFPGGNLKRVEPGHFLCLQPFYFGEKLLLLKVLPVDVPAKHPAKDHSRRNHWGCPYRDGTVGAKRRALCPGLDQIPQGDVLSAIDLPA